MDSNRTYSKEEISKILARASKIQTRKDLYGDEQGLTEEELLHIAEEVGIDKESLFEAIHSSGIPELDSEFNWFKSSSNIQNMQTVEGEISEESWEEIVQDIRRITGGIGKPNKVGKTFEWKQQIKEIGYKHLSFNPRKGSTQIQYISEWSALELILSIVPFFIGAGFTGILLDGTAFPGFVYFIIPLLGGLSGTGLVRFYLKKYFKKQKTQFTRIVAAVGKRLRPGIKPEIQIDEEEVRGQETTSASQKSRRVKS